MRLIQPLEQRIQQWNPDLVFLVLSKDQLAESKELLESVQSFKIPVIVVTEACDSEGMFELLKGGAGDFIMPPLDASNVLPRAWRLLETKSAKPEKTDCAERDWGSSPRLCRARSQDLAQFFLNWALRP